MSKVFQKAIFFTLSVVIALSACSKEKETPIEKSTKEVVGEMYDAFGKGDMPALKATLSDSTVWTYKGNEAIPYTGVYKGKDGAVQFITNIISNVDILDFKVNKMLAEGNTVVVFGYEKQKIKKNDQILEQKWVQVYTVENGLITRMEEFTDTSYAEGLFSK